MSDQQAIRRSGNALLSLRTTQLRRAARFAFIDTAWLFAILIPVQFFFAGTGMFSNTGFKPHIYLGLALHGRRELSLRSR